MASNPMPIGPARMPLLDHLGELRRRLTIIVVAIAIAALVLYVATPTIIDILIDPIRPFLPDGGRLTIMSALGGFTVRFRVALFVGVIVCSPIIIWEVMAFFLPALKPNERAWVVPTVAALVGLFFLGMVFCYFIIQPAAFGWLLQQTSDFANVIANAEDFLHIMMLLEIGFGLAFEMPLVIFYLSVLHVVPYSTFRKNWRIVYVVLAVVSAVVTPDGSPVTMLLMFAALVLLYEISLAVSRVAVTARDGKEALRWTREDYERHALDED